MRKRKGEKKIMNIRISGKDYKIGSYMGECPYKLSDIITEIKKVDKLNIASELYEYDCKLLASSSWTINMKVLEVLDMLYAGKDEVKFCKSLEEAKKCIFYKPIRDKVEQAIVLMEENHKLNSELQQEVLADINKPDIPINKAFTERFNKEIGSFKLGLTEEEFNNKLDEILTSDDRFTLDLLKRDMYWGLFDSIYTPALPKDFVAKFENGYRGDNKELLYKLLYLNISYSCLMPEDSATVERLVNECIVLSN